MAAANTDKFKKLTNNFATTLSSPIVGAGDTSMSLSSVTNLPTDTGIVLVIDRVDANGTKTPTKREYVVGTVSGSTVINLVRGAGNSTAQAHASGAVVEQVVDQRTFNDVIDGLLAQHNQDGTHGAVTATSVVTTGGVTSGTTLTASNGLTVTTGGLTVTAGGLTVTAGSVSVPNNTAFIVPANLTASTGTSWAWQSWTPTWTNFTIGNGTNACKYIQIGKTVYFRLVTTLGTTSSMGTAPTFTLPVTSVTSPSTTFPIASGAIDNTAGTFNALANWVTTTTALLRYWDTNNNGSGVTNAAPGAWGSGWIIMLEGFYEAA